MRQHVTVPGTQTVGATEGDAEGALFVGDNVTGDLVGARVGVADGREEGDSVGELDVGVEVGTDVVGVCDGDTERVGEEEGAADASVGDLVPSQRFV